AENPNLAVTLRTDYRSLNLSRREADIALRMVRPKQGNLLIRKVGEMGFGLYAHASYLNAAPRLEKESDLIDHRLLDWAEDYPLVSVIGWLRRRVKLDDSHFNADSAFARIAGAKAGMGIALLPHVLAKMHRELQRVASHIRIPNADIWLVTHKDSAKIPRIRAAMEFVTEAIRENQMSLTGD
ncbi:MAG: LysR substrate-binding domain-containing protein, partial [Kiloniellales bacterium]|nr:LysR substrate-binding domain-containing protein [Kiloniellales bacterium]